MPWGVAAAGIGAAGGIGSSLLGSQGAKRQTGQMQNALDFQRQVYNEGVQRMQPYTQLGADQVNSLRDMMSTNNPTAFMDPGYQFRMDMGNKAITSNAAANGLIQSGDTLRALQEFGQKQGSQEFGNAFNRRLGLAQMGQDAAAGLGFQGNQASSNVGNISANMNAGGSLMPWANLAGGIGGFGMNMLAKRMGGLGGGNPSAGAAGANAFDPVFNGGDSVDQVPGGY